MIKPGEFRITLDSIEKIINSSYRVPHILEECKKIIINDMDAQKDDYRYTGLIAGLKISQKSFFDNTQASSLISFDLVKKMIDLIESQYKITLDQFLEEQYLEFNLFLSQILDPNTNSFIFLREYPTTRIGDKRATWEEIDDVINEIDIAKYSGVKMTWGFIGARNDD